VQKPATATEPPLVTYRIYVDLAADHKLQMVFGHETHALKIRTSTSFFNDLVNGVEVADRLPADRLNTFPLALDSWITMGAASNKDIGVPREFDTDGSVLECPPYASYDPGSTGPRPTPLCIADGLVKASEVKEVVPFNFSTSYLGAIRGSELATTNGAWAVLGGIKGATAENIVLIAQLSTTGELAFELNLQIATPDNKIVRYVASDPAEGEILFEGLTHGPSMRSARP